MSGHRLIVSLLSALVATFALAGLDTAALAQNEQFIPALVYRSGPYAPNGIPFADGFADYLALINERDGGITASELSPRSVKLATSLTAASSATSG